MQSNRITQTVIVGIATLVSTITWSGVKGVLFGNGNWILPSIGILVLLVFLGINWLLTKSRVVLIITLIFTVVSYLFVFGFKIEYLVALFVSGLIFIYGSFRAIKEKEARIKIQVDKILRRGIPMSLTAIALMIAIAYYFSPLALSGENEIEFPRPWFDAIIEPVVKITGNQLFSDQIVSEQFGPSPEQLSFNQDIIYQTVNQEINRYSQTHQGYLPLGLSIGIFIALRTISIPIGWLAILFAWIIFKGLVASGAVNIQEKAVLKQMIEL